MVDDTGVEEISFGRVEKIENHLDRLVADLDDPVPPDHRPGTDADQALFDLLDLEARPSHEQSSELVDQREETIVDGS